MACLLCELHCDHILLNFHLIHKFCGSLAFTLYRYEIRSLCYFVHAVPTHAYRKDSIRPPGAYLSGMMSRVGRNRGEGLFTSTDLESYHMVTKSECQIFFKEAAREDRSIF